MADDPTGLPIIPAQDAASDARASGYEWGDIQGHLDDASQAAQEAGYTQPEIDAHLGYQTGGGLSARLGDAVQADPSLNIVKPLGEPSVFGGQPVLPEPGESVGPLTPDLGRHYASAVVNGEARTPTDFADAYLDGLGITDPDHARIAGADLSRQLPTVEDLTDHALAVMHGNGEPLDADGARTARANLADYWAKTGQQPAQVLATKDPILHDALTTPQPFIELPSTNPETVFNEFSDAASVVGSTLEKMYRSALTPGSTLEKMYRSALTPGKTSADILAKNPVKAAEEGFQEGVGTQPLGMSEETADKLRNSGVFAKPGETAPIRNDIVEPAVREVAKLGDTAQRLFSGVFHAIGNVSPLAGALLEGLPALSGEGQAVERAVGDASDTAIQLAKDERGTVNIPAPKLGQARIQKPADLPPPPGAEGVQPYVTGLEDDLYRLRTNATADIHELTMFGEALPDELKAHSKSGDATHEIETRLVDPNAPWSPETQNLVDAMRPITDDLRQQTGEIKAKLADKPDAAAELEDGLRSPEEGYARRVYTNFDEVRDNLDPAQASGGDVITGQPHTLSKFSASAQARKFYTYDYGNGVRNWGIEPLEQSGLKFGDKITDPATGEEATISPATSAEVEANTKLKAHNDFITDTLEAAARARRVNRNLDLLAEHRDKLQDAGLFVPFKRGSIAPSGMKEIDLPQMKGWADPHIANVLNDFYGKRSSMEDWLNQANTFLTKSLFISPFTHIWNVGAGFAVNRGWDWLNPVGYGRLLKYGYQAMRDVHALQAGDMKGAEDYLEDMRAGSAMQYPNSLINAGQNYRSLLLQRVYHEVSNDARTWDDYTKSIMGPAYAANDLLGSMYKWSHHTLWASGDVMMRTRLLELRAKGLSRAEAIKKAEKDIFNYRTPTQVATRLLGNTGAHALGTSFRQPLVQMFGRYHYGIIRSLAGIARDVISPNATASERLDALGKITALGLLVPLHAAGDWALRQIAGNKDGHVHLPWPGQLGWLHAGYQLTTGQNEWLSTVGKMFTLAPVWDLLSEFRSNRDVFGNPKIDTNKSPAGMVSDVLKIGGEHFYPLQLLLDGIKHGWDFPIAKAFGLEAKQPVSAYARYKWQKRDKALARYREMHDPIAVYLRNHGLQ